MKSEIRPLDTDAIRWAIRTLGLDKQTESLDSAAILRLVTESGYVVTPEWADAVQIVANPVSLASRPHLLQQAAVLERHQRCRAAVDQFSRQFFDLPSNVRRRRWEALVSDCAADSMLAAWLGQLEPGLAIQLPRALDDGRFNQLIQICRDAFVARPGESALLRWEFCRIWKTDRETRWDKILTHALNHHTACFERIAPWIEDTGDPYWRESLSHPARRNRSGKRLSKSKEPSRLAESMDRGSSWSGSLDNLLIAGAAFVGAVVIVVIGIEKIWNYLSSLPK